MAETLIEIKTLVRDLANQQSTDEISNDTLVSYINNWYQNKLPSYVTIGLDRTWRLVTIPYKDKYPIAAEYRTIIKAARINGEDIELFTNADLFFDIYKDSWENDQTFGTGDGATATFSGTIGSGYRIIPESVVAGDTVETFTDDGDGNLTGSEGGSGSIVYSSGALSITFNTAPASGVAVAASFAIYNESEPQAILYQNNDTDDGGGPEFVLRPIPDSNYEVQIEYEARPIALSSDSQEPLKKAWGDLIAYGAAIDIVRRYGDAQQAQVLTQGFNDALDVALSSEATLMSNKRPIPRW